MVVMPDFESHCFLFLAQENQPFEPHESRVKTPLKQKATSSSFLAEIQPAASCHLRTPPKPNEISPGDPWTPTANLKMLISAASPEIRNREQEKKIMDSRSETLKAKYLCCFVINVLVNCVYV